jgi:hypothetical protein
MRSSLNGKEIICNEIAKITKLKDKRKINSIFKKLGEMYIDFFNLKITEGGYHDKDRQG